MLKQGGAAACFCARIAILALFVTCVWLVGTPSFAAPGDCNSCHGTNVSASHHQSELYSQGLCNQCHEGVTTKGDCATCHTFIPQQNAHHDTPDATSGNCAQCHTNVGDLGDCLGCHQGSIRTPHHTAANDPGNPIDCASCHTTMEPLAGCVGCHGGNVQSTHHTAANTNGLSCQQCHSDMPQVVDCESCHNPTDYWGGQTAQEVHHASTSAQTDCTTCHTNAPRPFNCHDCHQGEAADRHHALLGGTLTCGNCHDSIVVDVKSTVSDCQDCHAPSQANQQQHHDMAVANPDMTCNTCHSDAGAVPGCVACHDAGYWGVDASNNSLTARDAHHAFNVNPGVDCNTCHTAMTFSNSCDSCHATGPNRDSLQAHHGPKVPSSVSCGFCHGAMADIPAVNSCEFCHDSNYWTAVGGNTAMGQHHDVVLGSTINDCQGCHDTLVPQTCATCHDNTFWTTAGRAGSAEAQHHDVVRMEGSGLACADCHAGGLPGENNDCQACHSGEAATFHHETVAPATNCQECHTELPVVANCESCHTADSWPVDAVKSHHNTPTFAAGNCSQCHTSLPVVDNCQTCHTAATWVSDTQTDHHNAAMSNSINCGTCHQSITTPSGNCRACHNEDWTYIDGNGVRQVQVDPNTGMPVDNMHHSTTSYSFGCLNCHSYAPDYSLAMPSDASCDSCHTTQIAGKDGSSTMHHATQAAVTNDCGACHQGIENITPASLDCATCHGNQPVMDGSPTMHHNSPAATAQGANCSDCHTGIDPASLDCATCHASQTAVAGLDGTPIMHHATPGADTNCASCHQNVVALDCAGCHIDPSDPTLIPIPERHHNSPLAQASASCADCHTSAATIAVNNCELCHTGTASEQATRHHATPAYAGGDCASCHEGIDGVSGDALDCATCHASKEKTGDTAMHHGTADGAPNYGVDNCATCHIVLDFEALVASNECYNCHTGGDPNLLAGRHHATAPAQADNCAVCHSVDQAELDCATCHATQPVLDGKAPMHHATATGTTGTCTDCHSSVDVTNVTCATCHASQPVLNGGLQMHHNTALATAGDCTSCHTGADSALMDCASCHDDPNNPDPNEIATRHHLSPFAQTANCTDCHTAVNTAELNCGQCHAQQPATLSGTVSMHHDMTIAGTTGQCATCHANATVVENDCSICHSGGTTIADTHHATPTYQLGDCSACHVGAEAQGIICASCHTPGNHHANSPQYAANNCNLCHTSITLNGSNCESCHGGGTTTIPELHHATPLSNVGGDCSVCHQSVSSPDVCANCHSSVPHHNTMSADYGLCESCHTWPADKNENPQQASCRQCHGEYMHNKNSAAPIHDYRACFDCHGSGGSMGAYYSTAAVPSVFHARPAQGVGLTNPAPGKGTFNLFYNVVGGKDRSNYTDRFGDQEQWENHRDRGSFSSPGIDYNLVQISEGGQTYQVPAFDNIPAPDIPGGGTEPGGGTGLSSCTSCHGDRSNLVACDNPAWTTHYSSGWVDLATYQLAESTYLGSYCGGGTTPPPTGGNLDSCTSCHGDRSDRVSCSNNAWTTHLSSGWVDQATYDLAESAYLGNTCDGGTTPPPSGGDLDSCTSCHGDRSDRVSCTNSNWTRHVSSGWVDQATYDLAETTYLGSTCGGDDDAPSGGGNLALNKSASASDDEGSSYRASRAVDGDSGTRWYVRSYGTEWLKVDLGSRQRISQVVINWHSYYAREYDVEVSTDNQNWTRVYRNESGNGGTDTVNFSARDARYVRVECNRRETRGYSIYELEVYH